MSSLLPTAVAASAISAVCLDVPDLGSDELADWVVDALREAGYVEPRRWRFAAIHVRRALHYGGNGLVAPEHLAEVVVEALRREGYLMAPQVTIDVEA